MQEWSASRFPLAPSVWLDRKERAGKNEGKSSLRDLFLTLLVLSNHISLAQGVYSTNLSWKQSFFSVKSSFGRNFWSEKWISSAACMMFGENYWSEALNCKLAEKTVTKRDCEHGVEIAKSNLINQKCKQFHNMRLRIKKNRSESRTYIELGVFLLLNESLQSNYIERTQAASEET